MGGGTRALQIGGWVGSGLEADVEGPVHTTAMLWNYDGTPLLALMANPLHPVPYC